ncbi:hypothetical protein F4703DRAFT_1894972 [Phycomyces blakesleeanus]
MSIPELPFEIINKIAHFVPRKDRVECITVCSLWRAGFQESLWTEINIRDAKHLDYICGLSTDQLNIYKVYGRCTRTLHLPSFSYIDKKQFSVLQNYFQEIQCLYAPEESLSTIIRDQQSDWSIWGSLKYLKLCIPKTHLCGRVREVFGILSVLPLLSQLDLTTSGSGDIHTYVLEDFETIHQNLPLLRDLSIRPNLGKFSSHDLVGITKVAPAKHLSHMKTRFDGSELKWLDYFSTKYPNLQTLELEDSMDVESKYIEHVKDLQTVYQALGVFPRLKSLEVSSRQSENVACFNLWKIIQRLSLPIKKLRLELSNSGSSQIKRQISLCYQSFGESLEEFAFKDPSFLPCNLDIPNKLGVWPRLVTLELDIQHASFPVDIILYKCKTLKSIRLSAAKIFIMEPIYSATQHHGLVSIHLRKTNVSAAVFSYISACCLKLSRMSLLDVCIFGPTSQFTGHLSICMKYTRFSHLYFKNVLFSSSVQNWCSDTAINILIFSQSSVLKPQEIIPDKYQSVKYDNPTQDSSSRWFHTYSIDTSDLPKSEKYTLRMSYDQVRDS